ncbi:hypothetical protein ABVT39_001282 [Epinephelus coioides]
MVEVVVLVRAEKEDFQGYHAEQTKGTTVTKDLLLKEENTIGQGIEAVPTENTHHHTAVAVAAKFPEAVLFDTRPTSSYERTQITKASDIFGSVSSFVSRNEQTSLTSTRDNPSATRFHNESEPPLISGYDKIVFSSTRAAFESKMNGTSKPGVYLSTDAVKASLWLHTLFDNRNQRNTDSITLTSAERGPGVPILSASHPRVIDNLAVLRNNNDDKRSQDKDNKGISNLDRNGYPLSTVQSIFRSNTAEDSVRGNTVTNLCLTCQRDRREVSTEKSVTLPALSPGGSSDSPRIEGLTFDFSQFTTSLPSLHQQSVEEQQEEMLNKDIIQKSITKHFSSEVREQPVYNLTFLPSPPNKTVNHGQNIFNNSQIKSFLSDTETDAFDTLSLAEMPSATQQSTMKQLRLISTTADFYRSSKSDYTVEKQETFRKKVSIWDPQSKLIHFSKHNNTSHSLSTNFKTAFVQNQPLDFKSGSVGKPADITEAPHSSQKSVFPEGSDHSTASHPTARMRLIEARSTIASFSLSRPTTSEVKNPESRSLTGRGDSLFTVLKSQTPAQQSSKTKDPIFTLLLKDSGIKFTSVTTKRHLTDEQDSQTVNTVNSIVKQYFVDPSGPASEPVVKKPQTPTLTMTKVVVPVKLFLSEPKQDLDDDVSTSTLTTISSKTFFERMTASRLSGSQSKVTQERLFDVSNDIHVAPTRQSFLKYSRDSLIVHNLKPGNKNEQVLTVVVEDEDKEIIKLEGEQGKEIKETEEIVKLQGEGESRDNEKLGNKREELFRSDKMESGKQEKIISTGAEINQNREREEVKMEVHEAETSREGGGGTIGEEDITLRQEKHPRHGEVRDEEGAGKGVTKKNTKNFTEDLAEKQRAALTKEGAEARRQEAASKQDTKCNREIGREDMTNVSLGPTTNLKDLMRDKGHTVTNLSSCHSTIKQLRVPEHKGIHPGEHVAQIVEMKNKPFSYKVTSNHRPLHSTLRSQSPKLSRVTSFPKETSTRIKLSTHMFTKHSPTSSLTKGSTQVKVVEAPFSVTAIPKLAPKLSLVFGVTTSKISDALEPTSSPHRSASKSTVLKSNMLPPTTPRLPITAELLRAKPHITVNSSTLSLSILYSISDHRNKFSTLDSEPNSLLQNLNESERAYIMPARISESNVKDPLTSVMIEKVNTSTSMNSTATQRMYNDSSTKPPTAKALSSVAHTSIDLPHQRQSTPQTNQPASSSFGMTSGQPRSFKLSAQTAHSDALHGPVDDNEQRSVQTLMASMSPKAENNQFPLSSMSLLPNLMLFGDDSLPGTYTLTGLTRSASDKEILRANSDAGYANSESGHAEILLGTADETNQTENGSMQNMVTSGVKHSYVVTKQMAESRDEMSGFPLKEQTTGRGERYASNNEGFNSLSAEKLAVLSTNEDKHNDLFSVDGNDVSNKTVKATLDSNHSQLGGYKKTSAQLIMLAIQTTHNMEEAINEDFWSVTNDSAVPVLDTNDPTGTTAFVESDSLPEIPQIQANDVTNNAISDIECHTAKTIEKQHDPSTPQGTAGNSAVSLPQIHSENDLKVPIITTQQIADHIMNITSEIQITTTKTNDFVSLGPTASVSSLIVSREAHESAQTIPESVQIVTERSSQAAHTDLMVQPNSHIGPLPLREPLVTGNTGKLMPAVKRRNTTEREISVRAIEQSQHAQPGMIAITRAIKDPAQSVQTGLLKAAHRDGGIYNTTSTLAEKFESSPFDEIKALTTKSASEAEHPPHEKTPTVLVRGDQQELHALPEKTSISQRILRAVTDSAKPTGITPRENKTSCRRTGCANSGVTSETTIGAGEIDHTALEKMYKTKAGNTEGDRFNAAHAPVTKLENGSCGTDCHVPEEATPQAIYHDYAALSPATSQSDNDHATVDETTPQNAKSMTNETSTRTEMDHLERHEELEQAQIVEKTTHPHIQTSKAQEAVVTEVTLSEPAPTTVQTTEKTTERILAEKHIKTQLNRGAAKAEIFEAQNATRSARAVAKGETAVQESGRRLLLLEPQSESELLKHRRRTSPHLYLSG